MNRNQAMTILLCGCIGAVLVAVRGRRAATPTSSSPPTPPAAATDPSPNRTFHPELVAVQWRCWITNASADPFSPVLPQPAPSLSASVPATNLVMTAGWCQSGHRLAMINGRMLEEGMELHPFRLIHVEPDSAELVGPHGIVRVCVSFPPPSRGSNTPRPAAPASHARESASTSTPTPP